MKGALIPFTRFECFCSSKMLPFGHPGAPPTHALGAVSTRVEVICSASGCAPVNLDYLLRHPVRSEATQKACHGRNLRRPPSMTSGDYSNLSFLVVGVGFILGAIGLKIKAKHKRTGMFLLGVQTATLGLWLLVSTIAANAAGLAHVISRHTGYFAQAADPGAFEFSFWLHSILGGLFLVGGLFGMYGAITRPIEHFKW